jgi:TPP-dependent pyruvate/acetoin dehydrogenase alpha subunit
VATPTKTKATKPAASLDKRDPELLKKIYEKLVQTRAVEDRMVAMYKSGDLLGSLYTGHWHEAISVGAAAALRPDDYIEAIHRDLGAHLWRGMESWQVMASFMGKTTSPTGGRDGTLHYGRLDLGFYNLPSHLPANFPVATGMAFAAKYRGEDKVCLAFCGDGSTSRADFHEAINIAGAMKLPNIFVIENNQSAYSTPVKMQTACPSACDPRVISRGARSTARNCRPPPCSPFPYRSSRRKPVLTRKAGANNRNATVHFERDDPLSRWLGTHQGKATHRLRPMISSGRPGTLRAASR